MYIHVCNYIVHVGNTIPIKTYIICVTLYRFLLIIMRRGIYHSPQELPCTSSSCVSYTHHRSSLQVQAKRMQDVSSSTPSRTQPSSHTNNHYLSCLELILWLSQEHHQHQLISKQCQRLKEKLELVSQKIGMCLDEKTYDGLKKITRKDILQSLPPNSVRNKLLTLYIHVINFV